MLTDSRICQCQCCRYMGPLYSNLKNTCSCTVTNEGKPFPCVASPGLSARICNGKIRPFYDPHGPNICCQLKFVQ